MKVKDLNIFYDMLQEEYGAKELNAIYNGGKEERPDICFIFMNPTGKNIASIKSWNGRRAPWIGTKNIWKLFYNINLLDKNIYDEITKKKPNEWSIEFADEVYNNVEKHNYYLTNLGKCTQLDARPLPDRVYVKYKKLLFKEIEIINPKVIVTFGNQVSSIVLDRKISVSSSRKKYYLQNINGKEYKVYPVFYPVGNGSKNIDKVIEDLNYIKKEEIIDGK